MTGSGVYRISNKVNGKKYVGSSVDLHKRKVSHLWHLRNTVHPNKHLQRAWNSYGESAFAFEVLEYVEHEENLLCIEQNYLDALKPEYNQTPTAGSLLGFKHSEESRQKIGEAHRVRFKNPIERGKMSLINSGRKRSLETRKRISEVAILKFTDPLQREKIRKAKLGKKMSAEACLNMRKAQLGRKHAEETKRKIGEAQRGEKNHHTKLTEEIVRSIKRMLSESKLSQREIARRHEVSAHIVHFIKTGRSWSHIQ